MQCRLCGTELPAGAAYCPRCGAVILYKVSESEIAPDDPTASPPYGYGAPRQGSPPPTDYGSPPYGIAMQNPYEPYHPYEAPSQIPPPPPSQHRVKFGLLIGMGVLVLALVSTGVFALFILGNKRDTYRSSPTPPSIIAPTSITATSANWSGWSEIPGNGTTPSAPTVTQYNNTLYLFAHGNDNRIYVNTLKLNASG